MYSFSYLGKYDFLSDFDQTENKKESKKHKIDFKLRKNTYLEQIESLAKMYKSPGVGRYTLRSESSKSKKKKISIDRKRYFYEDSEYLSTTIPGSACYYPHEEVPHVKV